MAYTVTTNFTPHTKVQSDLVDAEFNAIAAWSATIPAQATFDSANASFVAASGTANALIVAHPITTWTTYVGKDGYRINIQAATTNTGAATVNVDSLGVKTILRNNGDALEAGDLIISGFYDLIYDEAAGNFRVVISTSVATALNSQLLDGLDSTQFLRSDQSGTLTGDLNVTGDVFASGPDGLVLDNVTAGIKQNYTAGASYIDFEHANTSNGVITRHLRNTNTTGSRLTTWYRGNGTDTKVLELNHANNTLTAFGAVVAPGIQFPATQVPSADPNTLDDYEEGTFTATLTGSTGAPTTPITKTCRYTKKGREVSLSIAFLNVDTSGASGTLWVTGLPFINDADVQSRTVGACYATGAYINPGTNAAALLANNASYLVFYSDASATALSVNAGTGKYLHAQLTYFV